MISYNVYTEIIKNKKLGRNINQTAKFLNVSRQTVKKYWEMPNSEFLKTNNRETLKKRKSKADKYREEIAKMIQDIPEIAASTIYDRLLENHDCEIGVGERTIRRKVGELRQVLGIPKDQDERDYLASEELEPGQQAQVDFGEVKLRLCSNQNKRKKIYFFIMVLRYSRFKFIELSDRKFTAKTAIEAHRNAFEYFGGVPREIVYDQDSVFIVDENHGDLIETAQFRSFLSAMPFTHRVARRADPETKGCVEIYVKFVKRNFLHGRLFTNIEELNEKGLEWLDRTGNRKVCQATNKRPVDLIETERQALFPTNKIRPDFEFLEIIPHKVNKDNTVTYRGTRYRVPYGTYNRTRNHEVGVTVDGGRIYILDMRTHDQLANHPLQEEKGGIVGKKEEKPLSLKTTELIMKVTQSFCSYSVDASDFVNQVCLFHQRYIPDQMEVILNALEENKDVLNKEIVAGTLEVCGELECNSAQEFKNLLNNKCKLVRMDSAMADQMSAERAQDLPGSAVAAFCDSETEVKDVSSMSKLTSMWEIVNNEGEE